MLEAAAEIERLRADLAHADAKGQENDKLLWGTIKANERLRAALALFACDCAVNERCAVPDNCRNFQARRMSEANND